MIEVGGTDEEVGVDVKGREEEEEDEEEEEEEEEGAVERE